MTQYKRTNDITGNLLFSEGFNFDGILDNSGILMYETGKMSIFSTQNSSSYTEGALVIQHGGVSINGTEDATSITSGGALSVRGGIGIGKKCYIGEGAIINGNVSSNGLNLTGDIIFRFQTNRTGGIILPTTLDQEEPIRFVTNNRWEFLVDGTRGLHMASISSLPRVGINTTFPTDMLHVNGSIRAIDITSSNLNCTSISSASGTFSVGITSENSRMANITLAQLDLTGSGRIANLTAGNIIISGGNLGIGIAAPAREVHIGNGIFRIDRDTNTSSFYMVRTNPTGGIMKAFLIGVDASAFSNGSFNISDNGTVAGGASTSRIFINNTGNVGISTTNPTSTLTVNGSLSKSTGTFDIQHPLKNDPNERLLHSFVEAPRADLIYRGVVSLSNGTALVEIDKECVESEESEMSTGTFTALTQNAQLFLQNNDSFSRLIGLVTSGVLYITCENVLSNDSVNWLIIAERGDQDVINWNRTNSNGNLVTEYRA